VRRSLLGPPPRMPQPLPGLLRTTLPREAHGPLASLALRPSRRRSVGSSTAMLDRSVRGGGPSGASMLNLAVGHGDRSMRAGGMALGPTAAGGLGVARVRSTVGLAPGGSAKVRRRGVLGWRWLLVSS
jgi:hypothetical protein